MDINTQEAAVNSKVSDPSVFGRITRDKRIIAHAHRLWHLYKDMANAEGMCWPGSRYICDMIGCKLNSIKGWRQELIDAGYLEVVCQERMAA